jgi:hypothetical protein
MALLLALTGGPAVPAIYYVIGPAAGWVDPTDDEVVAGQLSGGGTATAQGSQASATSTTTVDFALDAFGLTPGGSYKIAYVWWDGVAPIAPPDSSNVQVSAAFTMLGGNRFKVWSGSAWTAKILKFWNGTAWVPKPGKFWNGTTWA